MDIQILEAYDRLEELKQLFLEYTKGLGIDLSFQNFTQEYAELPGRYANPLGRLYIAYVDGEAAGCIAMRPFDEKRCEMKRLYVRPQYRKLKLGYTLAVKLIEEAKKEGYETMLLDTLTFMQDARRLYERIGFLQIEQYYHNPIPQTYYMALKLQ